MDGVRCTICPRSCLLTEGQVGFCRARQCQDGQVQALAFAKPCALAVDPIEKKPLFHVFPGEKILSLGMAGCNLRCRHCQNSTISQQNPLQVPFQFLEPEALVPLMRKQGLRAVAYTYTEPLVAYEYVLACAKLVHAAGFTNVLVTAAYINDAPLQALLPYIHAVNVDIKGMSEAFYAKQCGISLAPVLEAVKAMVAAKLVVEVTNLIIPDLNDSPEMLRRLVDFVGSELGADVPVHFSRFFPAHLCKAIPVTPLSSLQFAHTMAEEAGLHHVYTGNIQQDPTGTLCHNCRHMVIERAGYILLKNTLCDGGICPHCGTRLYGRF